MFAFAICSVSAADSNEPAGASADAKPDFSFILNNAGTAYGISANKGAVLKGDVKIPATYKDKPVIKIIQFKGQKEITGITMPDTVKEIGAAAFVFCVKLENVTFSNNLELIEASAFANTGLKYVTIPASVTNIGKIAFLNCSDLEDVTFFSSEVSIGEEAFKGCAKLKNVKFESSAASIGEDAFRDCKKLENVAFGDKLRAIGKSAFSGCLLTAITIPPSVEKIGEDAFRACPAKKIDVKGRASKPDNWHKNWNFFEYGGHSGINEIFFPVNWDQHGI